MNIYSYCDFLLVILLNIACFNVNGLRQNLKKKVSFIILKIKNLTLSYYKRRTFLLVKKHFGNMNGEKKLYLLTGIVTAKELQY